MPNRARGVSTTTIYGHLMPNSNRHLTHAFDSAPRGGKIEVLTAARRGFGAEVVMG